MWKYSLVFLVANISPSFSSLCSSDTNSVKNFQMIKSFPQDPSKLSKYRSEGFSGYGDPEDVEAPSPVLLQMGKVGKHCFNMDYQYPLSMLQAFAICLSRFDTGTI